MKCLNQCFSSDPLAKICVSLMSRRIRVWFSTCDLYFLFSMLIFDTLPMVRYFLIYNYIKRVYLFTSILLIAPTRIDHVNQ